MPRTVEAFRKLCERRPLNYLSIYYYFFFPDFSSLSSTAFLSSLPTNSIRAISAPSPLRGPSLKIRVYPPGRSAKRSASSPVNFFKAATPAVASLFGICFLLSGPAFPEKKYAAA